MSNRKARPNRPLGRGPGGGRRYALDQGGSAEVFEGGVLGPGMTRADDASILAAMNRFDPDRSWEKARHDVVPMLPRVRPYPFAIEPVRTMLPPGILVGFGIDIGPALTMVDASQLARWGVGLDTVADQALDNVRHLASLCDLRSVVRNPIDGVPVAVLQTGHGIAASMLLVPETLPRFFGPGPLLFLAPMRDLLVAIAGPVDAEIAAWLAAEWEEMDPNHLHLGGWWFDGGTLTPLPLEDAFATA